MIPSLIAAFCVYEQDLGTRVHEERASRNAGAKLFLLCHWYTVHILIFHAHALLSLQCRSSRA